jgi:3-deoxy-D-manno-octulosonic-acid transferase
MHPLLRAPYTLAAQLARAASILTPPLEGKIAASLRARRGLRARVVAWGRTHRDPTRPLLWLHAPSVGEGLQARAVLEVLRARHPAWQVAYTFFSPSAANFARGLGADFTDYLPFDTAGEMRALCDALRPNALVFSKVDLWPVLAATAQERAIPLGMISATLWRVGSYTMPTRRSTLLARSMTPTPNGSLRWERAPTWSASPVTPATTRSGSVPNA